MFAQLAAGVSALGLRLSEDRQRLLIRYLRLLEKWNRAFNLTSIHDLPQMVTHHLLDSLSVLPFVEGERLLDVGSGAGLPGVALAVAQPELRCVLLDSRGKKTRFLTQAVIELKLANVEVVQARVEQYRPEVRFDTIVTRAFSDLWEFRAGAGPLLAEGGRLLAMKGVWPAVELEALRAEGIPFEVYRLRIPHLDAERHLVVIR